MTESFIMVTKHILSALTKKKKNLGVRKELEGRIGTLTSSSYKVGKQEVSYTV